MSKTESTIVARASNASQQLRSLRPEDDGTSALRGGVAANNEIGIIILEKVARLEVASSGLKSDISELKDRLTRQEQHGTKAADLILHERRSRLDLEEEITRTDLSLKKARSERWGQLITKILAISFTGPGLLWLWETLQSIIK